MGTVLDYQNKKYTLEDQETVLDCLLRQQIDAPHSCKSGVCQACLMQAVEGEIPEKSQIGLKPTFKQQRLFFACQCYPVTDMKIQSPQDAGLSAAATLIEKTQLNHNVVKISLRPAQTFECEPGQYLTLINSERVGRSYSIANNPQRDGVIELHIRLIDNGRMSDWLKNKVVLGSEVTIQGPAGHCFYACEENDDYPIILAGTGTGLAPLYGIANQALIEGHKGAIRLFHGALRAEDLYLVGPLQELDNTYEHFTYTPCVLHGEENQFYQVGDIQALVLENIADKAATRLYLCGAPEMVNPLKTKAFLAGLSSKHIFADPFLPSKS